MIKKIKFENLKVNKYKSVLEEVRNMRKVEHLNIIKYYNSFFDERAMYILMEYAKGGDLHQFIKKQKLRKKHFSEKDIWQFSWDLCKAVEHLHVNNIIHRDIKTQNIFLTKGKLIKLGDLGVS